MLLHALPENAPLTSSTGCVITYDSALGASAAFPPLKITYELPLPDSLVRSLADLDADRLMSLDEALGQSDPAP